MPKKYLFLLFVIFIGVSACTTPAATETVLPPPIVTIVHAPESPPTEIPIITETSEAQENCQDEALFIKDVTVPDYTKFAPGEAFLKTWRLENTGACTWTSDYSLIFSSGDQMNSPLSIPLEETRPQWELDISVNLVAPSTNGNFTGIYILQNPAGEVIPIGALEQLWVKIVVGTGSISFPAQPTLAATVSGPCNPQKDAGTTGELLTLINAARAENGLPSLTLNSQLAAAADLHSSDMACNSLLSHTGSDGSSVSSRIAAQGYSASYVVETIYPGGGPQDAIISWMNDTEHRDAILNTQITEIGIGYAYVGSSVYGGYFAVDFASP